MNIKQYLDSTYLKTAEQAGLTEKQNTEVVQKYIQEAIDEKFKLIMIRPDKVKIARKMIDDQQSNLLVGTVISFPEGTNSTESKLAEAKQAIMDGADELDYVCNYIAFQEGNSELVKKEIVAGSRLAIEHNKVAKWIIEVAALADAEIIKLSALIKNVVLTHFKEEHYMQIYVKSSTGFFQTSEGKPNGATVPAIIMMLENASPLPIKAAGGVRSYDDVVDMIRLGVKRIGTSSAKIIADGDISKTQY